MHHCVQHTRSLPSRWSDTVTDSVRDASLAKLALYCWARCYIKAGISQRCCAALSVTNVYLLSRLVVQLLRGLGVLLQAKLLPSC